MYLSRDLYAVASEYNILVNVQKYVFFYDRCGHFFIFYIYFRIGIESQTDISIMLINIEFQAENPKFDPPPAPLGLLKPKCRLNLVNTCLSCGGSYTTNNCTRKEGWRFTGRKIWPVPTPVVAIRASKQQLILSNAFCVVSRDDQTSYSSWLKSYYYKK